MRLRLPHRFATSMDEAAADKVYAAETDILAVRLAVIALNTVVYLFLFDKSLFSGLPTAQSPSHGPTRRWCWLFSRIDATRCCSRATSHPFPTLL